MVTSSPCQHLRFPGMDGRFSLGAEVAAMDDAEELYRFHLLKQEANAGRGTVISHSCPELEPTAYSC